MREYPPKGTNVNLIQPSENTPPTCPLIFDSPFAVHERLWSIPTVVRSQIFPSGWNRVDDEGGGFPKLPLLSLPSKLRFTCLVFSELLSSSLVFLFFSYGSIFFIVILLRDQSSLFLQNPWGRSYPPGIQHWKVVTKVSSKFVLGIRDSDRSKLYYSVNRRRRDRKLDETLYLGKLWYHSHYLGNESFYGFVKRVFWSPSSTWGLLGDTDTTGYTIGHRYTPILSIVNFIPITHDIYILCLKFLTWFYIWERNYLVKNNSGRNLP